MNRTVGWNISQGLKVQ